MEKISWTDSVRNEEVLPKVSRRRNILHTVRRRKAKRIDPILRKNCLLNHVFERKTEGRTDVTGRRGRRLKQLMHDLKENIR
jgi:hypothetical protein